MKAKILVSATTADKKTENLFDILSLLGEPYFLNSQNNNANAIKNYLRQNKYSSLLDMVSVVISLTTTKDMFEMFFGSGSFHLMRWSLPYNGSSVDFVTRDIKLADPSNTQSSRPFHQAE
jgi:Mg2+/Co2+ transporter CorB